MQLETREISDFISSSVSDIRNNVRSNSCAIRHEKPRQTIPAQNPDYTNAARNSTRNLISKRGLKQIRGVKKNLMSRKVCETKQLSSLRAHESRRRFQCMAASLQFILARLYQNVSQVVRKWERPDEVSMSRLSVSDLHS